ncbi:MAG: glycosyltransferase [Alphaproteobacteria bacterium]|nr:glycosyltransferase [Alphaproteobacteria bacterium]
MIGHWFKKKQKTECTADDVHFLHLLCLGRPALNGDETSPHIGQGFFATLKLFLGKQETRQLVFARLRMGKIPPHAKLDKDALSQLADGLERHFRVKGKIQRSNWLELLTTAFDAPRFKRAFLHHFSGEHFEILQTALRGLPAKVPDITCRILSVNGLECRGLVLDQGSPSHPITIDFFLNGLYVGTSCADLPEHQYAAEFAGTTPFGFTHTVTVPPALRGYDQLSLSAYEKESGAPIFTGKELLVHPTSGLNQLQRLSRSLARLRTQNGSQPAILEKLDQIEAQLPRIEKLGSFPLEQYEEWRELAPLPAPTWHGSNDIRFDILVYDTGAEEALKATLACLKEQSYPPLSVTVIGEGGSLTPGEAYTKALKEPREGSHLLLLAAGDTLEHHALAWFAASIEAHPEHHLYSADYETQQEGRLLPHFQSRIDYDLLLQKNTFGRAFVMSRLGLDGIGELDEDTGHSFHQYLLLRCYEAFGEAGFHHIPQILMCETPYSGPEPSSSEQLKIFEGHVTRRGLKATARAHEDNYGRSVEDAIQISWQAAENTPKLAVIIPTKDKLGLIKPCVESLLATLAHPAQTDIVIIDNGSSDNDLLAWFGEVQHSANIKIVREDTDFNWSALNNAGVRHTDAEYLLFLNDDTLAMDKGWDDILRGHLARDTIGAIGARLLYKNGTIQHAGMIFYGLEDARHEGMGYTCDAAFPQNRIQLAHACSAVTGAFLACRRADFEAIGGFDEAFAITFNDVDFCFKMRQQGQKVLYEPQITFRHFQSESRGKDTHDMQKMARQRNEANRMHAHWHSYFERDPYYPDAFAKSGIPFSRLSFTLDKK